MKILLKIWSILFFLNGSLAVAIEITGSQGEYQSRVIQGKIYDVRGKYTGMITPEGNMYDKQGNYTGKIGCARYLEMIGKVITIRITGIIHSQNRCQSAYLFAIGWAGQCRCRGRIISRLSCEGAHSGAFSCEGQGRNRYQVWRRPL